MRSRIFDTGVPQVTLASTVSSVPPASLPRPERLKVVSLSLVYPNETEPGLGLFIRERLQQLAEHFDLRVLAPVPLFDYSNPHRNWTAGLSLPRARQDRNLAVYQPLWLYPPGGTPVNLACLFVRASWLLHRLRATFPFALIDAHFGYPEGVVAAMLARHFGIPFVVTLRGSELVFAKYPYRMRAMKWALRRADQVIAVSNELRQFAIDLGVAKERVATIPNGIDAKRFRPRGRDVLRSQLDIPAGTQLIVTAGELIQAKGHHLIIKALSSLVRRGHNVRLFICGGVARGGEPYDRELKKLVTAMGLEDRVRFLGWLEPDKLAECMCAADLFCLASLTEGWPNVVHEAIACGTPVVATRVGAIPEMIPSDRYGLTVPPNDPKSLENVLATALDTRWNREDISAFGRSRSWTQVGCEVGARIAEIFPLVI